MSKFSHEAREENEIIKCSRERDGSDTHLDHVFRIESAGMLGGRTWLKVWLVTALALAYEAATATGNQTCFDNPSQTICADASSFYPNPENDLATACQTWSYSSGCSIRQACNQGKVTGQLCDVWSLLIEVCSDPIIPTSNPSCLNYRKLCDPKDSVVAQCKTAVVSKLLTTQTAMNDMIALCKEMPDMPQCPSCTRIADPAKTCPDPLLSVSQVCISMWMTDCQNWYDMCQTQPVGFKHYCDTMSPSSSSDVQEGEVCFGKMIMFFHTGLDDVVLFKSWVPCTRGRYALTFLGIIVCGLICALIKAVSEEGEARAEQSRAAERRGGERKRKGEGKGRALM